MRFDISRGARVALSSIFSATLVRQGNDGGKSRVGEKLQIRGWVRTVRTQKGRSFIDVNDGSSLSGLQAVVTDEAVGHELLDAGKISTGAAICVEVSLTRLARIRMWSS